jgi:hypothetical protein
MTLRRLSNNSPVPKVMSTPTTSLSWSESPSPALNVSTAQGYQGHHKIISSSDSVSSDDAPMFQRDDVYERTMSWWRVGIRRKLVEYVRAESEVIARMQVRRSKCLFFYLTDENIFKNKIRSPWLDAYFVYTSSLGTHTFFMILLPAFFFFGYGELARG